MLDIRKLKELVRLMVANDLTELDLRDSEEQVTLRRQGVNDEPQVVTPGPGTVSPVAAGAPTTTTAAPPAAADAAAEQGLITIETPMVGTFYAAPSPDASPFLAVGDTVEPDTVVWTPPSTIT